MIWNSLMNVVKKFIINIIFSKQQILFIREVLDEQEEKDRKEKLYNKGNYGENRDSINLLSNLQKLFN